MPKVVIKQGFLGLGRPIEKWYCDKCGVECQNQFYREPQMYCRACANTIDPDIVHMWSRDDIVRSYKADEFFFDTEDGQRKLIESCNRCLGLLLVRQDGSSFHRTYYRLGSPKGSQANFPCVEHPGYSKEGNVTVQTDCEHEFQVMGTSKRLDAEAHAKYKHMMSHRNLQIEAMFGADDIDIQYHCFGSTTYWCYKCGLLRSLNPQREHLLPQRGFNGGLLPVSKTPS